MKGHARNIMTEGVTSVSPDTQLDAISAVLVGESIGGVPVVDGDEVVGFVSDIDLMNALLREDPSTTEAQAIMSKPAIVIDEFAPCEEVITLLRERRIHHLPVVRSGKLVGIIAPSDVLRFFVEHVLPPPPEVG